MANLAAMLTFCEPGDRVVLEAASHVLTSEAMGIVEIARLEPRPLWARRRTDGPGQRWRSSSPSSSAALLILENTHTRAGGTTLSVELTDALAAAAKRHHCRVHIDGARLVNASVALGVPLAELAAPANSIALSLNKGLSAPMGTILAGSEAVVERARLMLQRLGGASVHRAGIPAAAGLVALDTMIDRIADDHRRARELARLLAQIPGLELDAGGDRDEHRPRRRRRARASSPTCSSSASPRAGRAGAGGPHEPDALRHAPADRRRGHRARRRARRP